jgi:hypothetical protein
VGLKPGNKFSTFSVVGKGEELLLPQAYLYGRAKTQLQSSDGGAGGPVCWEAEFSAPRRNTPGHYQAKSD